MPVRPLASSLASSLPWAAALIGAGLLLHAPARAGKAHEHGTARLDVVVEPQRITLQLQSPLDNLLGFERAPRTDAERKATDAMVLKLKAADALFKPDPAAQCKLVAVDVSSAALKLGAATPAAGGRAGSQAADEHADLDADITFDCKAATPARFIDVMLFDGFPRMKRLQLQAVTPRGQLKRTLVAPAQRVDFGR